MLSKIFNGIILVFLIYLTLYYSQVSILMTIIHIVLTCAFGIYFYLDVTFKYVVNKFTYFIYVLVSGIAIACCLVLTYMNLVLAFYTYPIFPLLYAFLYMGIAGSLISSIFKLRIMTLMKWKRKTKYWELKE